MNSGADAKFCLASKILDAEVDTNEFNFPIATYVSADVQHPVKKHPGNRCMPKGSQHLRGFVKTNTRRQKKEVAKQCETLTEYKLC